MVVVLLAALMAAAASAAAASSSSFEPLLFMDLNDTHDSWGLVWPVAHAVAPNASFHPPPVNYSAGSTVLSVIASATEPGSFEVYAENTTGWEPLGEPEAGDEETAPDPAGEAKAEHACALLRYTTSDFVTYSAPHVALRMDLCSGTPTFKSIARSPAGRYVMFYDHGGYGTFTSNDAGMSWAKADTTGVVKPDKDDLNIIYNTAAPGRPGRFVDMQIVWQNHTLRYCDNGGCEKRRVVSAKTSPDGVAWSADLGLIAPDSLDPPELEFYRMRPFYLGHTSRMAAHVLQYAPAPSQDILGTKYGRQPSMCSKREYPAKTRGEVNGSLCHGPHLYEVRPIVYLWNYWP